jgi:hypothetical protein
MRRSTPSSFLFALTVTLAIPAAARAQEGDAPQAQALFVEGRAAMEKGNYAEACAKFTQSLALVRRAGTLVNLAQCEEKQGKLIGAAKHWKEGIDLLPPDDERLAASKERAASLSQRIPRVSAKLAGPAPAGAHVTLDGVALSFDELTKGVPVDPGPHTVVLTVPGNPDERVRVDLAEGQSSVVALALVGSPQQKPETPAPSSGGGGMRVAGFTLIGVGAVGAVIAGVTGGILVSKNSQINTACPVQGGVHECTPQGRSLINGTGALKVANGIGWGLGIAGVGVGAVLVAVGGKKTEVSPTAFLGGGGVSIAQQF